MSSTGPALEAPFRGKERMTHVAMWAAALILAARQAWIHRYDVYSDGLSYLDIGDAYWRRDWANAINGYWSPLYAWITGAAIRAFHPSAQVEGIVIHVADEVPEADAADWIPLGDTGFRVHMLHGAVAAGSESR